MCGGRGNCLSDVLYERRSSFKLKRERVIYLQIQNVSGVSHADTKDDIWEGNGITLQWEKMPINVCTATHTEALQELE